MIFEEIEKKGKLEIWAYRAPTPQRREPMSRRRPTPRCGMPRSGTPRVLHDVDKLRRGEGLRRSVAVLHRGVATVHRGQNFGFCSESLVFVHR